MSFKRIMLMMAVIMAFLFMLVSISLSWPVTLINRWLFLILVGLGSAWISLMIGKRWAKLTGISQTAVNFIGGWVIIGVIVAGAILMVNYSWAYKSAISSELVVVTGRCQETHYHTRRISRKVTVRGAPYQVYFVTLDMPGAGERKMKVEKKIHDSIEKGDTVEVAIGRGILGWPVIKAETVKPLHPRKPKKNKTRRCRFVGSRGDAEIPNVGSSGHEPPLSPTAGR